MFTRLLTVMKAETDPVTLPAPAQAAADLSPVMAGDHPAMHMLNTLVTPGGQALEWIGDGEALRRWLRDAAISTDDDAAGASPAALDAVAAAARRFREWFRGFVGRHAGGPLSTAALDELAPLNDLLREDSIHRAITVTDGSAAWTFARRQGGAQALRLALLQPLAVAAGNLVCDADFTRVRQCAGPGCTIWFLDRTKGGQRRWCSMAVCGNRAKASTHRHRARQGSARGQ